MTGAVAENDNRFLAQKTAVKHDLRRRPRRKKKNPFASRICTSYTKFGLITTTAKKLSMVECSEFFSWNVFWTDFFPSLERFSGMKYFQRINHFPGMLDICRKDLMAENLNRLYKHFPKDYDFFPRTWCLPEELAEMADYAKLNPNKVFIVKPTRGSEGRGIFITKCMRDVHKTRYRTIAQEYIYRPLLIDGYKFDFRLYVLITSCDPLRIFVYNEGLARFATKTYKPTKSNLNMKYMHLTNYAVNRRSSNFVIDDSSGSKRTLSNINEWFVGNGYDVKGIWNSIDDVIIKTFLVALSKIKHYYKTSFPNHVETPACFELLGFDFILDQRLKPYLLEVNYTPSFNRSTPVDKKVKDSLLHDTFCILNLSQNDKLRESSENKGKGGGKGRKTSAAKEKMRRENAQKSRVDWENSHMGNYRRIYPSETSDKYKVFIKSKHNRYTPAEPQWIGGEAEGEQAEMGADDKKESKKPRKNPFVFEPTSAQPLDGIISKRKLLIQSHDLLQRLYEKIQYVGRRSIEDEIVLSRSGQWDMTDMYSQHYNAQKKELTQSITTVLKCISRNTKLTNPEKEKLSSLFLDPPRLSGKDERLSHIGPIKEPGDADPEKTTQNPNPT